MNPHYFTQILYPEKLEEAFREALTIFSKKDQKRCEQALTFAKERHEGQRRDEGTPYYSHCIFASLLSLAHKATADDVCTLLLHDTLEDTPTEFEEIVQIFGEEIALNVRALSHKEKGISLTPEEYLERLLARPACLFHKACDRVANLYSTYVQPKRSKKIRMMDSTRTFYIPLLKDYPLLIEEMEAVMSYIRAHAIIPKHLKHRIKELQSL